MEIVVRCFCGASFKIDASHAGKQFKCTKCLRMNQVPTQATPAPAPTPNIQSVPPPPSPSKEPLVKGWGNAKEQTDAALAKAGVKVPDGLPGVNQGVQLVMYGTVVSLGLTVLSWVAVPFLGQIFFGIINLLHVPCLALILIGQYFCLGVPEKSKAKGLIVAAVACNAIALLGYLVSSITIWGPIPIKVFGAYGAITGGLLWLASHILFLLFLRAVALWVKQHQIAEEAMSILFLTIGYYVVVGLVVTMTTLTTASFAASATAELDSVAEQFKNEDVTVDEFAEIFKKKAELGAKFELMGLILSFLSLAMIGFAIFLSIKFIHLLNEINFRKPVKTGGRRPRKRAARIAH